MVRTPPLNAMRGASRESDKEVVTDKKKMKENVKVTPRQETKQDRDRRELADTKDLLNLDCDRASFSEKEQKREEVNSRIIHRKKLSRMYSGVKNDPVFKLIYLVQISTQKFQN